MCIGSPTAIAVGAIPITPGLFFTALTAFCLETKWAVAAVGIYIAVGIVGIPVFSGFRGGIGVILSPTGGFIISYVLTSLILSWEKRVKTKAMKAVLSAVGLSACYGCGTAWYMLFTKADFFTALTVCAAPFAALDSVKIFLALKTAQAMRKRIKI